jgi:hypothetical protein
MQCDITSSIIIRIISTVGDEVYFARGDYLKSLPNDIFSTMSSGDIYERHTHTCITEITLILK